MSTHTETAWFGTSAAEAAAEFFGLEEETQMPVLHRKAAPVASEDRALLEAAQFAGPRDIKAMLKEARRIGELLGDQGFYSWRQGGSQIEGPTIALAYALSQVWGRSRTQVIVVEEEGNRVKLRGRYIDLLTIAVTERDFLAHLAEPPGKYAQKPDQAERWRVMQLQSAASKAVRGAILAGLPAWYVDAAFQAAKSAAARTNTGGKPLGDARRDAIEYLGALGLDPEDLEAYLELPVDLWAAGELGELRKLARGLKNGEVALATVKAENAAKRSPQAQQDPVSYMGEVVGQAPASRLDSIGLGGSAKPAAPPPEPKPEPEPSTESKADPLLVDIMTLEKQIGTRATQKARTAAGLSPNPRLASLGDKRKGEYLLQLQNQAQALEDPESTEDAVRRLEGGLQAGAVRRLRSDCRLSEKDEIESMSTAELERYHAALVEEYALIEEAAAAAAEAHEGEA